MSSTARVHVIDDDAEVRGALGSLLRSAGHDVALHEETDDFLASGQANRADCLVLDIRLRGESGLDFQERLAEQGIRIPVILMTGYGDIPMTVRGMKAGAVDFLPKPFSDDQMLTAVAAAIEASRTQRAKAAKAIAVQEAHDRLTPREREVMALVVTGLMNKQVAARLNLSEITVKIHRGNVMRKMAAQSLADLVRCVFFPHHSHCRRRSRCPWQPRQSAPFGRHDAALLCGCRRDAGERRT